MVTCILAVLLVPGALHGLFSTGFFMPHRHCYLDNPRMLWLQGLSDLVIGLSYMAIAAGLAYLVRKARKDIPFEWMFLAFGLFIFSCGWTHFMEVWTLWHPTYWLSGTIKAVTAAASLATAIGFFPLLPHIFGLIETAKASEQRRRDLTTAHAELQRAYERLQAEEARARLAAIVESSEDAIIGVDLEGRITTWNAAARQVLGYEPAEIIGQPITTIIPPESRAEEAGLLERIHNGESVRHYETVRTARDGRPVAVSLTLSPVRDHQGQIIGASKILRDITGRKQREEALRQSEQRFRQLADAMPQIVWAARPDGYLDYYNRRWYELTGARETETGDQSWLPILHPEDRQRCLDTWYKSVRTGQHYQIEYRFKFPASDSYRWHLGRAVPVRNEHGEIVRWFGTSTDIDDLKRTQAALAQARDLLEQTVAERTAQLVEANANLRTFSHTAAHDLRSPLRAINNFSAIVLQEYGSQLGSDGQSLLQRVVDSARQMDQLLTDLLEYSKITQAELRLEPVSLERALREALELLEADIHGKQAAVAVVHPLPEVIGHRATTVTVLNNLLSNAMKFVAPGAQPQIRIWAEPQPGPTASENRAVSEPAPVTSSKDKLRGSAGWIRLCIADNGIGIAREHLAKIFEPFERLHGKQVYPGTGLGLAIVRKAVERMGGRVGVESEPGRGSRFWIELPELDKERVSPGTVVSGAGER